MNSEKNTLKKKVKYALEAVQYAIEHSDRQLNKPLLSKIRDVLTNIDKGDYEKLDDLKSLVYGSGRPEGSGPENDIFAMDVHVSGKAKTLFYYLSDLISELDKLEDKN